MPAAKRADLRLMMALYACEAGIVGTLLGRYKLAERSWWRFGDRIAIGTACALGLAIAGCIGVARSHARLKRAGDPKALRFALLLNAVTIAVALLLGEVALRVLAEPTPRGAAVLGVELRPYSWDTQAAHRRATIREATREGGWTKTYLVPDSDLGWTVGKNRTNAGWMCHSSKEGIRSPTPGVAYADIAPGKRVIALVGDSYTFGLDVRFEESWAGELQRRLGDEFVVLNFGVDGYGVDQAYLRYLRDVVPWKPEVVVFGMIQHDLFRTFVVYPFLAFPTWKIPFSKPRMVLEGGSLVVRNVPLPRPIELFGREAIAELPHLDLELSYEPAEWRGHLFDGSLFARIVLTKFRPRPVQRRPIPYTELRDLNVAIFRAFRSRCTEEGSIPLLAYLPTNGAGDFPETAVGRENEGWARNALRSAALPHADVSKDLRELPVGQRFQPAGHYSAAGYAAAARGIHRAVRAALGE